jgi:ribosomal protein S4E
LAEDETGNAVRRAQGGTKEKIKMKTKQPPKLRDGAQCKVVGGTHDGKEGIVRDINTSKTGHVTITVVLPNGERFKTLAKNVVPGK